MPAGVQTDPETVAEFRANYLYSGNASESARKVGLPESTGRDLARILAAEPEFVADRRSLRENALQELVAMRMRVARKALKRFEARAPEVVLTEKGAVVPQDKRADFGKLVLEAEKNAHGLAKAESGTGEEHGGKTEVHIHLAPEDDADDGDSSAA